MRKWRLRRFGGYITTDIELRMLQMKRSEKHTNEIFFSFFIFFLYSLSSSLYTPLLINLSLSFCMFLSFFFILNFFCYILNYSISFSLLSFLSVFFLSVLFISYQWFQTWPKWTTGGSHTASQRICSDYRDFTKILNSTYLKN